MATQNVLMPDEGIESGKATPLDMSALQKKATALLHKEQGG
jgi:post-segregation antitoxin (ccd killing protein)